MIKANQKKVFPKASVSLSTSALERLKNYLVFPVDAENRRNVMQLEEMRSVVRNNLSSIENYKRAIVENRANIKNYNQRIAKLEPSIKKEALGTVENAKNELESLAKLPWIENIQLRESYMLIKTRPGMLKTMLTKRYVYFEGGVSRIEFLSEPVQVPMPTYELFIDIQGIGDGNVWGNRQHKLAIRLINQNESDSFIGGKVINHNPRAHWAAERYQVGTWSSLCLGEYEDDILKASCEGLIPFLSQLAEYLQSCGDEHAYIPKLDWSLSMGNPAYNAYVYRIANKDETPEQIDERYKRDFKTMNAVVHEDAVAPGNAVLPTTRPGIEGEIINNYQGLLERMMQGQFVAIHNAVETNEFCLCYNQPEVYENCNCGGECACHNRYREG